jgi:hypothetical protein
MSETQVVALVILGALVGGWMGWMAALLTLTYLDIRRWHQENKRLP